MVRRPELLVLVAVWDFIVAFLAFIGILAILVIAFPAVSLSTREITAAYFGLGVGVLVLVAYTALSVMAGIGLSREGTGAGCWPLSRRC